MSIDKQQLRKARGHAARAATGTVALQNLLRLLRGDGFGVLFLVFVRYAGAVVISIALVMKHVDAPTGARHKVLSRFRFNDRAQAKRLLGRGFLMLGVTLGIFFGTQFLNNTQLTSMGLATWPVLVQLIGRWRFNHTIDRHKDLVISIVLSAIGICATAAADWSDVLTIVSGFLIVLATSTFNATNQLVGKRTHEFKDNTYLMMFYQSVVGFVASLGTVALFLVCGWSLVANSRLPWYLLVLLLVGVGILGFLPALWLHRSTEHVAPGAVAAVAIVQVPIGFLIDWLGFGILPNLLGWIAIPFLAAGAYYSIRANTPVA